MTEKATTDLRLIDELKNSIDCLGPDQVIKLLREARTNTVGVVFIKVTATMDIAFELLRNTDIHYSDPHAADQRKVALGLGIYFLKTQFECNTKYIIENMYSLLNISLKSRMLRNYCSLIKDAKLDKPKSSIEIMIAEYLPILKKTFEDYKPTTINKNAH